MDPAAHNRLVGNQHSVQHYPSDLAIKHRGVKQRQSALVFSVSIDLIWIDPLARCENIDATRDV